MGRGDARDEIDRLRLEIGGMLQEHPPVAGAMVFMNKAAKVLHYDPDEALKLLRGCLWWLSNAPGRDQ